MKIVKNSATIGMLRYNTVMPAFVPMAIIETVLLDYAPPTVRGRFALKCHYHQQNIDGWARYESK